jgi:soluble lytic murein transglycosylase-like protein
MSGERGKPAQTGELTDQPARTSPVAAVAGALLGTQHRVKPASPARAHARQADDTRWRIARRFYDNPLMWWRTYYANRSQTHDPNVIHQSEEFTIPQAGTIGASTSATSANPAQANAPSSATGYIRQTARGKGLPGSAAVAQVQTESGYQARAILSAGAGRPYRVMPSRRTGRGFPAGEELTGRHRQTPTSTL